MKWIKYETIYSSCWRMEGYEVGSIIEVYCISSVKILGKNSYQYCLSYGEWISESECIDLATKGAAELEVCVSNTVIHF
jgi:hypothetical protein